MAEEITRLHQVNRMNDYKQIADETLEKPCLCEQPWQQEGYCSKCHKEYVSQALLQAHKEGEEKGAERVFVAVAGKMGSLQAQTSEPEARRCIAEMVEAASTARQSL